jgi:hypothetical protein
MLRRPFVEEPNSKLAVWSARLAMFSLVVVMISIVIVRSGILEIVPALATFGGALIFAGLGILLAFASFIPIWRQGLGGLRYSILALILGTLLLAYPGYLVYRASKLPAISDVTTDTVNPPQFDVLARLRPSDRNAYPGAAFAGKQKAAYPDIMPLEIDAPTKAVYDAALALVTKRKWQVVDARPPGPARRDGVIEAVARTLIMGFRDDVVIRVGAQGGGSRVDVRSASRYGLHDFGANAKRVRALLSDIDDSAGNAPEPRAEPAPPAAKKPPAKKPAPKR